jgi:hypothetical protein
MKKIIIDNITIRNYLYLIIKRQLFLIVKIFGSRKTFIQFFMNFVACYLLYDISEPNHRVVVYSIATIANLIYFKVIQLEDIKMEVKINK